jgi:hypothetical protein
MQLATLIDQSFPKMKRTNKLSSLATVALMAALLLGTSTAHAVTVSADPGTIGNVSDSFLFFVPPVGGLTVDVMFTDDKTLEFGAGLTGVTVTGGTTKPLYTAGFLDLGGNLIPGTEFGSKVDADATEVNLAETTVISGIQFVGEPAFDGTYALIWLSNKPTVGVVPVPAAVWLFGSGLIGLVGVARRKKAA